MAPIKSIILFTADPWESAMPVIRVTGPAKVAEVAVLQGNGGGQVFLERITQADLVIIQRDFPHLAGYDEVVDCARAEKKPIIYEIDDLLFELPDDHVSYENYLVSLLPMAQAAASADAVITSTARLRDYYKDFNPNTWLVPNLLNDNLWSLKPPMKPGPQKTPVVIGYMGGQTHLHDLEMIAPVLLQALAHYGDRIQLRFWGGSPPDELRGSAQVEWIPLDLLDYQQFATYFTQQTCDFFIAPLRDNFFNQCKSPIKFLEYSALGIPGIYSRVGPYKEIIQSGSNGLLASTLEDWQVHLDTLIGNPQLRFEMSQRSWLTLHNDWLLSCRVGEWLETYQQILDSAGEQNLLPLQPAVNAILRGNLLQKKLEGIIVQQQKNKEEIIVQQQKNKEEIIGEFRKLEAMYEQQKKLQAELEDRLKESNAREQHLTAELNERTNHLQAVLNSRSWRFITKIGQILSFYKKK